MTVSMEHTGGLLMTLVLCALITYTGCLNMKWCPKPCDCYNQYTTVDCSNKQLTQLPPLSNLTQILYLEYNDIAVLPDNAFQDTPNLLQLDIQHNNLRQIESRALCGLEKLQQLQIGHNQLAAFETATDVDCKLPNLKDLALSGNKLKEIPRNLSAFAPNLEILNLHHNDLVSAAVDDSFRELRSLENLDLSLNRIHELGAADFDALRNVVPLEILQLADCGLVNIHRQAFMGLNNLTTLSLSRSLVPSLSTVFAPFAQGNNVMAHLDISEMLLPTLSSSMLGMFHKLIFLDVSYSGVEYVEPELFDKLPEIETLHLEENELTTLNNIWALTKLRRLFLSGNKISNIILKNLTKLEVVNLSSNKLREIPEEWICDSENLIMINLSKNDIASVNRHAFCRVTLNTLDLSRNKLSVLGPMGTIKIRTLDLTQNFILTVSSEAFYYMSATLGDLDLGYNQITTLPLDIFEDFQSLQRLCLSHNDLGISLQDGRQRELFRSLGHLQVLDLSYNNIQSLPGHQFAYLHHLTTLNLRGNQIVDLASLGLRDLPSLAKLIISNNRLTAVKTDILKQLDLLEVLDLSLNPYECTCNILPFLDWLNSTRVSVLEHKNQSKYTCMYPPSLQGQYIYQYSPDPSVCPLPNLPHLHHRGLKQHQRWTILGIVLACILLLFIVLGLVLYFGHVCHHIKSLHYRWQVRYREVSGVEIAGDPKV